MGKQKTVAGVPRRRVPARRARVKGRKAHLKEVGMTANTRKRYKAAIMRFFVYLIRWGIRTPRNVEELDLELSEFINHLWQDDLPEQHAMDALSGFGRLLPHCRGKLPIARSYFANWRKTLVRVRALPLTHLMVTGLAGLAYSAGRPDLAAVFLTGFRGLLRSDEMVSLKFSMVLPFPEKDKCMILLQGKSGVRHNIVEKIIIEDKAVVNAILVAKASARSDFVYASSERQLSADLKWLGDLGGLPLSNLTLYALRRGGATFDFQQHFTMGKTMELGRWATEKTARIYIDQAMAQQAEVSLTPQSLKILKSGQRVASSLLNMNPKQAARELAAKSKRQTSFLNRGG